MEDRGAVSVVTVTVPARAAFVHVLRAVTASVASKIPMPYDGIDDLRLAVDEACAWLLAVASARSVLTLRLIPSEGALTAVVSADAADVRWPPEGIAETFSWRVLSALVDEVAFEADRAPSIRLVKRTLEPSRAS